MRALVSPVPLRPGQGGDLLSWLSDCYRRSPPRALEVDGDVVGIVGIEEIMEVALGRLNDSEETIRGVLLSELKARNYVPGSEEDAYLDALWDEYEKLSVRRREDLECTYQGVPREEIRWYPVIDSSRCEGCSSCVDFCSQNVFSFYEGTSHVMRPMNCIVGKSSCRDFCPDKAISFPTKASLRKELSKLKAEHGVE
jgi:NAD-dependent dihydropyrimidine dehydrogenase PreA subunit